MYINIKIDNVPGPDSNKEMIVIHFGSTYRKINYSIYFKKVKNSAISIKTKLNQAI